MILLNLVLGGTIFAMEYFEIIPIHEEVNGRH